MKLVVFGATGSTGRQVVEQALLAGHDVVAIARRPDQVAPRPRLTVRAGDVLDAGTLHESCSGADAVVSCLGPPSGFGGQLGSGLRPGVVMSVGTAHMVAAAKAAGVRRFVFQSGIGLSDGSELSRMNRWVMRAWHPLFAAAIRDKAKGEQILQASGMQWVIVRPVVLQDAPAVGHYLAAPRAPVVPLEPVSFADCAACLLRALDEPGWTRQIVNLGRDRSSLRSQLA